MAGSRAPLTGDGHGEGLRLEGRPALEEGEHGTDSKELWPAILEKAFAKFSGGSYDALARGGEAYKVIEALTGKKAACTFIDRLPAGQRDGLLAALEKGLKKGEVATASTTPASSWGEDTVTPKLAKAGLVPSHAYSVLEVVRKDGEVFVKLRNPWAEIEPSADGKDDGTFLVAADDFFASFGAIHAQHG